MSNKPEAGINVLLQVGDGDQLTDTTITHSIADATTLETTDDFVGLGVEAGMRMTVSGFSEAANAFSADVVSVATGSITFRKPVDGSMNAVTPVVEVAGDSVTLTFEKFTSLDGQDDTSRDGSGSPIDVSDKTTGGWGATLTGTRSLSISCSGNAKWPDTDGIDYLREIWEAGSTVNCKAVDNAVGDHYYGPFSVTQHNVSGATDSGTKYSIGLQNASRPTYVKGA